MRLLRRSRSAAAVTAVEAADFTVAAGAVGSTAVGAARFTEAADLAGARAGEATAAALADIAEADTRVPLWVAADTDTEGPVDMLAPMAGGMVHEDTDTVPGADRAGWEIEAALAHLTRTLLLLGGVALV